MLTSLCALLFPQRSGPPAATRTAAPRRVTAAYLRMHDPEFVARALASADTPQGGRLAVALLPKEALAARAETMARLPGYFDALSKGGRKTGPMPSYGDLARRTPQTSVAIDLGTAVLDTNGYSSPTRLIEGTASRSGTLKIDASAGDDAISISNVFVFAGTSGKKGLDGHYYKPGDTIPIQAGQDYNLLVLMDDKEVGAHTRTLTIDDGHKTVVSAKGTVLAHAGKLACWVEQGDVRLTANASATGKLHAVVQTNDQTIVRVTATCDLPGVKVQCESPVVGDFHKTTGQEVTIPFTVDAPYSAKDGTGTIRFKATIFVDKEEVDLQTSIKVQTLWTVLDGAELVEGAVHARPELKYSDAGDWWLDVHTWGTTTDAAVPLVALAFASSAAYVAPGYEVEGPLATSPYSKAQVETDGKLYSFVHYWSFFGTDDRLRAVPPGTTVPMVLLVGKPGALASAGAKWADWQKAHPFSPFGHAINAWTY